LIRRDAESCLTATLLVALPFALLALLLLDGDERDQRQRRRYG